MNPSLHFPATGVGSLPHLNPQEACQVVFSHLDFPYWPQLTRLSFLETMYAQFSQGLPGIIINSAEKKIYLNTSSENFVKELETCYGHYLRDAIDYFAISQEYARGLYEFIRQLTSNSRHFIKGQVTGPVSFGLSLTDENRRSVIYHPEVAQILTKIISMKAKWQINKMVKGQGSRVKVIIFIDEPYLVSIGSSFISIKKEEIIDRLNEVIEAIHQEDGLAGLHCCGNTDWSILLETELDILNFDAYNYFNSISLYPEYLKGFLKRGGILAWGIVPTSADAESIESEVLVERFKMGLKCLVEKGLKEEALLNSCWITPSCGCGTLSVELAEKVHHLTARVSQELRKRYL